MKRVGVILAAVMLMVGLVTAPVFAAPEEPAAPEAQESPTASVEGILLGSHSDNCITGKLHFGMNGDWVHLRDFICPACFPRDISADNRFLVGTGSVWMDPTRIFLWDMVTDKMEVIGEEKFPSPNTEVHFSPRGDKVLFFSGTPEIRWGMYIDGIYLIDLATRKVTPVTSANRKSRVVNPRWSEDGNRILYVEWFYAKEAFVYPDDYIGTEIRAYNVLTGQTETLVEKDYNIDIEGFEVVPGSNRLVVNRGCKDRSYQLMLYDLDNGQREVLLSGRMPSGTVSPIRQLAVAPGGDKAAYCSYTDGDWAFFRLAVVDLRDKTQTTIADNMEGLSCYGLDPVWSPDGRGLLYAIPDTGDWCQALVVVPDITRPGEKELSYAEQQIYFYRWVTAADKQTVFKGPTGVTSDVVGHHLWEPHLERYTPLGATVLRKGDLEFELVLLPTTTPEYTDRLSLDVVVRKNGRFVKSEDLEGTMWVWLGDRGHGKGVFLRRGHDLVNDFYDPEWGRVTVEFDGKIAGQPVKVRGSLGLDR